MLTALAWACWGGRAECCVCSLDLSYLMGQSQTPLFSFYYGVHFFYNPKLPYKNALVSHTVFHEWT